MSALWICELCGGPAKWTFIAGQVWYHCEDSCDGFMQMELFAGERVDTVMRGDDPHYEGGALDQVNTSSSVEELPF